MNVVIVGAGLAGLTLATKLVRAGIKPVIIERENDVGGLARSFSYANGGVFDIGPHRFHTDDAVVQQFVEDALGKDRIDIYRNSQLYLFDRYLPWPLTLKSIFALPPHLLVRSGLDLFMPRKARTESFEDYIVENYGRTLYNVFFKPYTEKFLEYTCANLHRDWATTGINRATIDKKVNTSSLIALAKSILLTKPVETSFIYPGSGGIGVFSHKLADEIRAGGGRFLLEDEVARFTVKHGAGGAPEITSVITEKGEEIPADYVFWSGSLRSLREVGKAPESVPRLHYLSTIIYNYMTTFQITQGFQWCYFGEGKMEVARICVPRNFNPACVPKGKEGICIEVSCLEGSQTWREPSRLDCRIETFLLRAGLLDSLGSVDDYHVERIRETYPLYVLNYPRKLSAVFDWVYGSWRNMTLIGRTGRFWYNNMDHSIAASLRAAERFIDDYKAGSLKPGSAYSVEDRYLTGTTQ